MSFQHKSLWLPRDSGCFAGENLGYENSSRVEQKRDHQWFMNTGEPETFSNKKQAVEAIGGNPFSGVSHVNVSPWDTNSGFHSVTGQFSDRLFGSDPRRAINLVDKNLLSTGSGSLNVARRDVENQFRNEQSSGLSRSHAIADTSSDPNFGGIRKVKVNQVRDSYNLLPASIGHPYSRADSSTISIGTGHNRNDANISLGSAYNNGNDNIIAMVSGISNTNNNSISMDRPFNKADGSFMLMNQKYGLSMSQPFNRADFVPMDQSYSKGHENFIPTGPTYSKPGENFINISPFYGKGLENLVSMGPTYISTDSNIPPTLTPFETGNSSSFLAGHNYNKGVSGTMPFIAFTSNPESNPSGGITNGYNLLMGDQINPNAEQPVNNTQTANTQIDTTQKNKEKKTKKASSNNFPSNVKSLLSTGIFDGVVVKYVSWSREKSLGAVIKGTGYVCSCDDCKESKCLNAYEFERHAGAKTKHPNNHIYFENGKTVYGVVQELKNTPQEMLFDAIQNVTGTTINEKNFSSWKASYQAATKELQRIYGFPTQLRTYYSIYHPDPSPFPPIQTQILTSALQHVPRLGFSQNALLAGAKEHDYREVTLNLFPRGVYDLIHFYLVTQRLNLKDRVQFQADSKLGLTQKVKTLTWARLQANIDTGIIEHWQDALGHMSLLENIPASLKELGNLSDEIWYLSGDKQVDFGWYTKRAQLAAVYASTEVFMTTDKSKDFSDTKDFLERRLGDVHAVGGAVSGAMQYAGWWAGNGLGLARAWGMKV